MKIIKFFILIFTVSLLLCSCEDGEVLYDPSAPVIEFAAQKTNEEGIPEFYLFDDNPEYLNSRFLADGENPNTIAYFENLSEGIYTVFSYHHRGDSVEFDEDLYFDTAFSSTGAEVEILNFGLDHDWNWNQAWADFTGIPVFSPEYYKTFNCTCGRDAEKDNGECAAYCPAVIKNQAWEPEYETFESVTIEDTVFLSDIIERIEKDDLNHFRYGSRVEPMWLMMKFRVVSGSVDFATVAYTSKQKAYKNFDNIGKGEFVNEPQYKGIAESAPIVTAEFELTVTDETREGAVPITVKNRRVPDGYTVKDGIFATYVNTWRLENPIAAESDLLSFEYEDDAKPSLYGENAGGRDNLWRFDPVHTKLFSDDFSQKDRVLLKKYGIKTGEDFLPNIPMSEINHPKGAEKSEYDFYRLTACNLGNFGVTTRYVMHLQNTSQRDADVVFEFSSDAGQVYRYSLTDENGKVVSDDGGRFIMKKYDNDPAEKKGAKNGERIEPANYTNDVTFSIEAGRSYTAVLEITTLTGCNAPMKNRIRIEC